MDVYHVNFLAGRWRFEASGAEADAKVEIHSAATKAVMWEFVTEYMTCRQGEVVYHGENGAVEFERRLGWSYPTEEG